MKLRNPFSLETRLLYLYEVNCQDCGRSDRGLELNHIAGRCSNSPYNAIAICRECHSHCGHNEQEETKYFIISVNFHNNNGYVATPEDNEFINSYPRLKRVVFGDSGKTTLKKELETDN